MAEQQEMIVETRLGRRTIDAGNVLYFPRGIAGFEGMHRFVLLRVRPDSPMVLLQSLDNAELGLLVTNPFAFCPDYPVRLSTAERNLICLQDDADLLTLVSVSIPAGRPQDAVMNLSGPIVVNMREKIGLQVLADIKGPSRLRLRDLKAPEEE